MRSTFQPFARQSEKLFSRSILAGLVVSVMILAAGGSLSGQTKGINEFGTRYGGYYNGTRWNLNGKLYHRKQPFSNFSIVGSYDRIALPAPYSSANLVLIGPRMDLTFTDRLFLTTYVQYNNQINNLNLNIRLQWRFAPVSDLFVVYSDNSYPDDFQNKNRGLVMKISYWFN